jgi:hypothetical protein
VEGCARVGGREKAEGCAKRRDVKRQGTVRAEGYEIEGEGGSRGQRANGGKRAEGRGRKAVRG